MIIALMTRRVELRFRFAGELRVCEARPQKVELGVQSRDYPKLKTPSGLTTNWFTSKNTCFIHACRLQQASAARNGCWQSLGQPDSPQADAHDVSHWHTESVPRNDWCSHSSAATRVLHPCSTPELLPTASSLYLILDFTPACYQCRQQTHHTIKGFERDCRLHLSGWILVGTCSSLFSSRIVSNATLQLAPACRTSFQPASWPELAISPISRSLASA